MVEHPKYESEVHRFGSRFYGRSARCSSDENVGSGQGECQQTCTPDINVVLHVHLSFHQIKKYQIMLVLNIFYPNVNINK